MKLQIAIGLTVGLLLYAGFLIVQDVRTSYQYDREIGSYWSLADKSNTLSIRCASPCSCAG
jgi:hypothetical protein